MKRIVTLAALASITVVVVTGCGTNTEPVASTQAADTAQLQ